MMDSNMRISAAFGLLIIIARTKGYSESPERCFAPVLCTTNQGSTTDWMQVFPHRTCELQVPAGSYEDPNNTRTIRFQKGDKGDTGKIDEKTLSNLDDRIESLLLSDENITSSLSELARDLRQTDEDLNEKVDNGNAALNSSLRMQLSSLETANAKRDSVLNSTLQGVISKLDEAHKKIVSLQDEVTEANNAIARLKGDASQARIELSQANSAIALIKGDASQARVELSQANNAIAQMKGDVSQARNELSQANNAIARLKGDASQARMELSQAKADLQAVKTLLKFGGGVCPIPSDGKCFFAITDKRYNRQQASSACQNQRGDLANIDSTSQMSSIIKYIRANVLSGTVADYWLGMTIDPQTKIVSLRDGQPAATDLSWDDYFPSSNLAQTGLLLRVNQEESSSDQYLWNVPPTSRYLILCEFQL